MEHRSTSDFPDPPDPQAYAEAVAHPLRGRILAALAERPDTTIRRLAERLEEPPRRVRHHLKALLDRSLVEVTGEETYRGVIQRRYGRAWMGIDDVSPLSTELRVALAKAAVRLMLADMRAAAAGGVLCTRPDELQVRMYGEVDDTCLEELAEIHWRAYREIRQTVAEGSKRVRESGEPGTEVVSALLHFEAPVWGRLSKEP